MADKIVLVRRYVKIIDCPDSRTYDVCYVDLTNGQEVMRYDGADPANTREDYGAKPDAVCFAEKGLNLRECIEASKQVDLSVFSGRYTDPKDDDYSFG